MQMYKTFKMSLSNQEINLETNLVLEHKMFRKNMSIYYYSRFKTYEEVYQNIVALGSGILHQNLAPKTKEHLHYEMGFVAI